jgi:hypothetical protein
MGGQIKIIHLYKITIGKHIGDFVEILQNKSKSWRFLMLPVEMSNKRLGLF